MLVKDVMDESVDAVAADAPLTAAMQKMVYHDGGVLAVSKEGQLLGTISEHDIVEWEAESGRDPMSALVSDVMKPNRAFLSEKQDIRDAVRIMREEHVGSLLVARDQQAVGRVALADLAGKMAEDGHPTSAIESAPPMSTSQMNTNQMSTSQSAQPAQWPQPTQWSSPPQRPAPSGPAAMVAVGDPSARSISVPSSTSIFLRPVASPSILGFYGLAAAALVVGCHLAGWYGTATTPMYILGFVALFGGVAQFTAAMWGYAARDGLSTAIHGTWGAFWAAYGVLYLMVANGALTLGSVNMNLGFLFIPLCAITIVCAIAAIADRWAEAATLLVLSIATGIAAVSLLIGSSNWIKASGWVLAFGALLAWYVGSAALLEGSWRRLIIPFSRPRRANRKPGDNFVEPGLQPAS